VRNWIKAVGILLAIMLGSCCLIAICSYFEWLAPTAFVLLIIMIFIISIKRVLDEYDRDKRIGL